MTPEFTITTAGDAALVNAQANGTNSVQITAFGVSENALTPTPDLTALPNELKRVNSVSGGVVAAATIHVVLEDMSADAYSMRSVGLYLSDGTLFAVYGQADPLLIKTASSDALLATDIQFANIDATQITFGATNFFNPPATTTVQGVAELATADEATAGTDDQRIVTPKGMLAAVSSWLDGRFGAGAPSAFIKSLLTSASAMAFRASIGLGNVATLNTGAGNGIDSDKLDGQEGNWYTDILARLGWTPVNKAGDTGIGNLSLASGGVVSIDATTNGGVQIAAGDATRSGTLNLYTPGNKLGAQIGKVTVSGALTYNNNQAGGHTFTGGQLTRDGSKVWDASNDGAGSGMDTDLFQGQAPSYYTNIIARLGYTPLNKAGDTMTGSLAMTPGNVIGVNSGNGYGGVQIVRGDNGSSGYTNLYMPDNTYAGYMGRTLNNVIASTNNLGGGYAWGGGQHTRDGNKMWDAGNDGAGSGMDTDYFRGHDLSEFRRVTSSGQNSNGRWRKYSDGTIEMEGVVQINVGSNITTTHITFPTPVDNGQLARLTGNADRPANNSWTPIACMFVGADANGCTLYTDSCNVSQALQGSINVNWRMFTA